MNEVLILFASVLFFFMLPVFFRVIKGPTAIDRIVAVNIIGTKAAILLVVIGTLYDRVEMFVDFALTYAMLNYIGSLVAARFYHKMHVSNAESLPHFEVDSGDKK